MKEIQENSENTLFVCTVIYLFHTLTFICMLKLASMFIFSTAMVVTYCSPRTSAMLVDGVINQ